MRLPYDGVDEIDLQPHPLEEEITACSITVALYIELRQVWLFHKNSVSYEARDERLCYLYNPEQLLAFLRFQFAHLKFNSLCLVLGGG